MTSRSRRFAIARCLVSIGFLLLWLAACGSSGGGGTGGSGAGTSGTTGSGGAGGSSAGSGGSGNTTGTGGGTGGTGGGTGGTGGGTGGTAGTGGTGGGTGGAAGTAGRGGSGSGGTAGAAGTGGATTGAGGAAGSAGTGAAGSSGGSGAAGTAGRGGSGGGAAGSAGSAGAAGAADGGACQKGQVAANEVLIVGDSYFPAASSEIPNELRRLSGKNYRDVSVAGTKMAAIAASYTNNRNPPPKVVIMDGGGNDILQNPGCTPGCAQEVQAVTDARNFFKTMAMDGTVRDVVFIFYYDMPVMKDGLDWMRPKMLAECQQSPIPCHFVDNQPLFAGMDASSYTTDGIHPTKAAADIIAKQTWDIMVKDCVAQ